MSQLWPISAWCSFFSLLPFVTCWPFSYLHTLLCFFSQSVSSAHFCSTPGKSESKQQAIPLSIISKAEPKNKMELDETSHILHHQVGPINSVLSDFSSLLLYWDISHCKAAETDSWLDQAPQMCSLFNLVLSFPEFRANYSREVESYFEMSSSSFKSKTSIPWPWLALKLQDSLTPMLFPDPGMSYPLCLSIFRLIGHPWWHVSFTDSPTRKEYDQSLCWLYQSVSITFLEIHDWIMMKDYEITILFHPTIHQYPLGRS